jgi:serine/threonine protein kinase
LRRTLPHPIHSHIHAPALPSAPPPCLPPELCAGGQLVEVLADSPGYCECDAARLAGQLLSALAHCHGAGVAHLDIKP